MKNGVFVLCLLAIFLLAGCSDIKKKETVAPVRQQFINIATGSADGNYYAIGGALAELLNKDIPGFNANAQTTASSMVNLDLLAEDKAEMALVRSDLAYYAAHGLEMYKDKKIGNLQSLTALYPEYVHVIVSERSGIKKIEDIRGFRVAVGLAGSSEEISAHKIMQAYGIQPEAVVIQQVSLAEAADNLRAGRTDVIFATAGLYDDFVKDLSENEKIFILSLNYDKLETLTKEYPFYVKTIIEKGTYAGQSVAVPTLAVMAVLLVNDKIDAQMGYKITSAIYNDLAKLKQMSSAADQIKKASARDGLPLPLNEGAAKFFSE